MGYFVEQFRYYEEYKEADLESIMYNVKYV